MKTLFFLLIPAFLLADSFTMQTFRKQQRVLVLQEFKHLYKQRNIIRHKYKKMQKYKRVTTVHHDTMILQLRENLSLLPQDIQAPNETAIISKIEKQASQIMNYITNGNHNPTLPINLHVPENKVTLSEIKIEDMQQSQQILTTEQIQPTQPTTIVPESTTEQMKPTQPTTTVPESTTEQMKPTQPTTTVPESTTEQMKPTQPTTTVPKPSIQEEIESSNPTTTADLETIPTSQELKKDKTETLSPLRSLHLDIWGRR